MRFFIGGLLIIFGCSLLFYPKIEKVFFDVKQQELIEAFERIAYFEYPDDYDTLEVPNLDQLQSFQTSEREKSNEYLELLDGAEGIIRISKIDLEILVFKGADETSLKKGVGIIEPEKKIGVNNVGIAGHRGIAHGKQFNRLGELTINDEIEIFTRDGIFEFIVVETFVVDQKEIEVLNDKDEPFITLVTCTPIGKRNTNDRLIVQGKLKK